MRKRWLPWVLAAPITLVVIVPVAVWTYLNVVRDDAPDRLTLDAGAGEGTATTAAGATPATAAPGAPLDGVWKVGAGSTAGYRVKEILFGQDATAVGRTDDVTGQIEVAGTTVTSASFTVDMTTVASDESRRDNQFRGRIMDVARFPTSTFVLTAPVSVGALPGEGEQVTVEATGDLTLRGTTRRVTVDLGAQRSGGGIRVAGSIPVVFGEWGIPNPSFGPAEVGDRGELEFLLVLTR
ncbi:MAG TPA: YceI family protein [Acidimicrobiales bacterium]|nr:YceI family protein [Acidimicrobiales bacterium]